MKIIWQIDPEDTARVKEFFNQHCEGSFVKHRIATNLAESKQLPSKEAFWDRMIGCLLTTQQRSGPESAVSRFIQAAPFPLRYKDCVQQAELAEYAQEILSKFGGLRRSTVIGKEVQANLLFLEGGGWESTMDHLNRVRLNSSPETEREAAEFVDEHLKGFGPKQSRNLIQSLGLSRYEIPLDSRITKWLNNFGFPVKLTAKSLQDRNYYNFVSEGFQRLSEASDLVPCVLDAAIFASFDNGRWTDANLVR